MNVKALDYEIIQINDHDFIRFLDGTLIPAISGGRTEPPAGGDPPEAKDTYTKEEVAKMLADNRKLITQLQQGLEQQQSSFDELVEAIAQAVDEEGGGEKEGDDEEEDEEEEPAPTVKGKVEQASSEEIAALRRQISKMGKQMEEMQGVVKNHQEAAEAEREMRLASQRDQLLTQALQEAGVIADALDAGLKLFRDNVIYDEEKDEFFFEEDKTGVKLPISEGVKDNIPNYLKATQAKTGGSGSRGSQVNVLLDQSRASLAKLHDQAKKTGSEADIAAYHAAKKKLIDQEKAAGGASDKGTPAPRTDKGVKKQQVLAGADEGESQE